MPINNSMIVELVHWVETSRNFLSVDKLTQIFSEHGTKGIA